MERVSAGSTRPTTRSVRDLERDRVARRIGLAVLALVIAAGAVNLLRVHRASVEASGGGTTLTVEYARVTRSGAIRPAASNAFMSGRAAFGSAAITCRTSSMIPPDIFGLVAVLPAATVGKRRPVIVWRRGLTGKRGHSTRDASVDIVMA